MCTCSYICVYVCVYTYIYTYVYLYIHWLMWQRETGICLIYYLLCLKQVWGVLSSWSLEWFRIRSSVEKIMTYPRETDLKSHFQNWKSNQRPTYPLPSFYRQGNKSREVMWFAWSQSKIVIQTRAILWLQIRVLSAKNMNNSESFSADGSVSSNKQGKAFFFFFTS